MSKKRIRVKMKGLKTLQGMTTLGATMGVQGPASAMWQVPAVSTAGSTYVSDAAKLAAAAAKEDLLSSQARQATKEREDLEEGCKDSLDMIVAAAEAHAVTEADLQSVGFIGRVNASYAVKPPSGMSGAYDRLTGDVDLTIDKAPGIDTYEVEHSTTPAVPASFSRIEGIGSTRKVKNLPLGDHWFQAKSTRGGVDSTYVGPILVTVK